jgi:glucosylceramidase
VASSEDAQRAKAIARRRLDCVWLWRAAARVAALALVVGAIGVPAGPAPDASARSRPTGSRRDRVEVIQTNADLSMALTRVPDRRFRKARARGIPVIDVNDRSAYQRVTGFGGTMTDSAAWLLERNLPPSARAQTMRTLFGPRGIRLGFLRVPMGASDFTSNGTPYSYDDLPPGQTDPKLARFSIAHDDAYVIPALREALANNSHLELLASPWSPPGWMKANGKLDNERHTGTLLRSAYAPLAAYFVKFIQEYRRRGVRIDDLTPQNEPGNPTKYPGLELGPRSEARLIRKYLAPALLAAKLHPRIYGHDLGLSRDRLGVGFAKRLLGSRAAGSIAGLAWHCYFGSPDAIGAIHRLAPNLDQIEDECAPGVSPMPMPAVVISALRNQARVVAFWSLALDPKGGPLQRPHYFCPHCTGLVTVDEATRSVTRSLTYFQLGQASKFIDPGAQRIRSPHFVSYRYLWLASNVSSGLDDVAFRNPDGSLVLLAYNSSSAPLRFAVRWHRRTFTYTLLAGATVTFIWNRLHRGR